MSVEPRGNKLISRYKKTYGIPAEVNITEQMILAHWDLEKQLTSELRQSAPADRWDTFDHCYTRLYAELEWLNQFSEKADPQNPHEKFGRWVDLIGQPPKSIYEIGSGQGGLISFLAAGGYDCRGTEITRERGQKLMPESRANPSWAISDGVHLDEFEPPESYDIVVSDQLIEHIHPDDLDSHLRSVRNILKSGGKYIFNTPHRYTGPHDVSRVFKCGEAAGMHLKEYTCRELVDAARRAGYRSIHYGFVPRRFLLILTAFGVRRFGGPDAAGISFLRAEFVAERFLRVLRAPAVRRGCGKMLSKFGVFSETLSIVAEK
ncbi:MULTISPECIES: class I SAM-dependent methyltransferase [Mycobacterium]|uniref:Methyltransferase n=1 Tax=Mycobacterium persicum TaxID=1487726 RepID=A0AB38UXS9_9MYCO|nr:MULTISPECIES: class I SAM-dependent methyltransferase [Mycobacterium]VAZ78982.1 putative methyltransferase [Mycobacterium persicum]VAZ85490.1 putative methyltransferase [Mycobacterium persicum]VAZ98506.1 putative methyltransferase [Mycobacterium persicum]